MYSIYHVCGCKICYLLFHSNIVHLLLPYRVVPKVSETAENVLCIEKGTFHWVSLGFIGGGGGGGGGGGA